MSGYSIRLLIPKLKTIQNRIKNKNVGYSKEIGGGLSANLIESPPHANVLTTTTIAPLLLPLPSPMKNCTVQEPDKPMGLFFFLIFNNSLFNLYFKIAPKCLDEDYYDEDEDDLGDRLGQNAVLSLIGGILFFL